MIAKVLVDVMSKNVDKLYDYIVPSELEKILEEGMRVIVEFGHRHVMGFVLELVQDSDYEISELKPVESLIDLEPMLTKELIKLAYELQQATSTLLLKMIETMVPSALKAVYKTKIDVLDESQISEELSNQLKGKSTFFFTSEYYPFASEIKTLIKKNALKQSYEIHSKSRIQKTRIVTLINKDIKVKNEKQQKVIDFLQTKDHVSFGYTDLLKELEITSSVLSTLEKYGSIQIKEEEVYRELYSGKEKEDKVVSLNEEQTVAYEAIMAELNTATTFLLHGVTGSGKTEIYIKVMEEVIRSGKQVLFLVPEIALTPMMIHRFQARFKNQVACLHSGLSIGEKYDEWRKIIRNEVSIVIGARSACFAPLSHIGVMIVDECHESTYKQDEMPSYYAVDVLERRAKTHQSVLILGSATPNVESYARYKRGYYKLLTLTHKAMNSYEPDIEVIDMKEEFKSGNTSLFSVRLLDEIKSRLERKEQVILLLNRRGYSNFVMCRNCGHVFQCPNCDISLTYHERDHSLKCHYCGHKEHVPTECTKCKSTDLIYLGSGTQQVEEKLQKEFPLAKIIRMDNDSTRTKNAHQFLLESFEQDGDILLGTQMIAKGLDFPRVTLVGIIQADGSLYNPDYRASEKTFQLIMQVSGRSGRHDLKGKVIVQAFNPNHYAISFAVRNAYIPFYEYEMKLRKISKYSPFYYIHKIELQGDRMRDLFVAGYEVVKDLRRELQSDSIILGPTLPVVSKIKNKSRCEILIKFRNEEHLYDVYQEMRKKYESESIFIRFDMFPSI